MKKILKPGKTCWNIFDVITSGVIIDGHDYYKAFYQAALRARHYIFLAGWQFDSSVKLLREQDKEPPPFGVTLITFLNELSERNKDLEIYLLAWDFSVIYTLDREWFQEWVFNWSTNERIHFRFDSSHAIGASHHQKFVVIDGLIAFAGGLDICSNRWDNRHHHLNNPDRIDPKGKPYEPYHDMVTFLKGSAAVQLSQLFRDRWQNSGGGALELQSVTNREDQFIPEDMLVMENNKVALSRTQARTIVPAQEPIHEIRNLYHDAILSAEKFIYFENQYFSSQAVFNALTLRMKNTKRPKLQIVMLLPKKPHAFIEELSIGITQTKMLQTLKRTAQHEGHSLGIYYTLAKGGEENDIATYIHSKLIIVDDKFLSVGSANITNRSMGLDTELNVSWEAGDEGDQRLLHSINNIVISLLIEHTGVDEKIFREEFFVRNNLVASLNTLIDKQTCRLRKHTMESIFGKPEQLKNLKLDSLSLDPEQPIIEEDFYEILSKDPSGTFAQGITFLNENLINKHNKGRKKNVISKLRTSLFFMRTHWVLLSTIIILLGIFLLFVFRYLLR
jgi:phosphatidylserine/phosphatidylglycerophosphate/cardiolipin synthase-like enzyme